MRRSEALGGLLLMAVVLLALYQCTVGDIGFGPGEPMGGRGGVPF